MGCYMSAPDNRVYVTEGEGKYFKFATASCQGWRREQEDAEDCIPDFDDDASLFILCDGHGGAEVAKYTVEHLPNFIKDHPLYKEGKYEQALERAFIDFDALLRTDEVMETLNKLAMDEEQKNQTSKNSRLLEDNSEEGVKEGEDEILPQSSSSCSAGTSSSSGVGGSSTNNSLTTVVEDVDTETLREEAKVPLEQLLEKYNSKLVVPSKRLREFSNYSLSPVIRARRDDDEENGAPADKSSSQSNTDPPGPSTSKSDSPPTITEESLKESLLKQVLQHYFPKGEEDSSEDDSEFKSEESSNDEDGDDEDDEDLPESSSKKHHRKKRPQVNRGAPSSDEEDDSEEDDSDEEEEDEDEESDATDDEEEDEDEEVDGDKEVVEDDEDDDDYNWEDVQSMVQPGSRPHTPGLDSGCTAVVALLKGGKLYVASAGDSRCIMIPRTGDCKAMSFDHKPEDTIERRRIYKAGGRVTEGRVNGGLNLSRALGDFSYKNAKLDAKDQMITPCPDVKVADFDPEKVEYIFLACDGIWNSMKNQQVARFIRKTALEGKNDLVDICVQLFRLCIAPRTDGDGTGCDNMTCIIARIPDPSTENSSTNNDLKQSEQVVDSKNDKDEEASKTNSQKRSTTNDGGEEEESTNEMPSKRRCIRL